MDKKQFIETVLLFLITFGFIFESLAKKSSLLVYIIFNLKRECFKVIILMNVES